MLSPETATAAAAIEDAAPRLQAAPFVSSSAPSSTPVPASRPLNRRWNERAAITRYGWIGDGGAPTSCKVLNLSKYGAMLDVQHEDVPDTFVLVLVHNRVRSEATCMVRWRNGTRLGVSFMSNMRTTIDCQAM